MIRTHKHIFHISLHCFTKSIDAISEQIDRLLVSFLCDIILVHTFFNTVWAEIAVKMVPQTVTYKKSLIWLMLATLFSLSLDWNLNCTCSIYNKFYWFKLPWWITHLVKFLIISSANYNLLLSCELCLKIGWFKSNLIFLKETSYVLATNQ